MTNEIARSVIITYHLPYSSKFVHLDSSEMLSFKHVTQFVTFDWGGGHVIHTISPVIQSSSPVQQASPQSSLAIRDDWFLAHFSGSAFMPSQIGWNNYLTDRVSFNLESCYRHFVLKYTFWALVSVNLTSDDGTIALFQTGRRCPCMNKLYSLSPYGCHVLLVYIRAHRPCMRRILDKGVDTRALLLLLKLNCVAPVWA